MGARYEPEGNVLRERIELQRNMIMWRWDEGVQNSIMHCDAPSIPCVLRLVRERGEHKALEHLRNWVEE